MLSMRHFSDAVSNYTLTIKGYSGTAGDSLSGEYSLNGLPFTTYDRDNDSWYRNCAEYSHGAWWYKACTNSNLNGNYLGKSVHSGTGMTWLSWKNSWRSLKESTMMIRPRL